MLARELAARQQDLAQLFGRRWSLRFGSLLLKTESRAVTQEGPEGPSSPSPFGGVWNRPRPRSSRGERSRSSPVPTPSMPDSTALVPTSRRKELEAIWCV